MATLRLDPVRHLAVPAAVTALFAVYVLAVTLPLGGRDFAELLARHANEFTPAEFTFAVWPVILIGVAAFVPYSFLPSQGRDPHMRRVELLLCVACFLGIGWFFSWHFEWLGVAVVAAALLVIAVALAWLPLASPRARHTLMKRLLAVLPLRLFLGWSLALAAVTVMAYLTSAGWGAEGIGEQAAAVSAIGLLLVCGLLAALVWRDWVVGLVLAWTMAGVALGHWSGATVTISAIVAGALLIAGAVWVLFLRGGASARPPEREPGQTPLAPEE